jgi:predicted phosphodiesterase
MNRRRFLQLSASAAGLYSIRPLLASAGELPVGGASFFLASDTHYLANKDKPDSMDDVSRGINTRLVEWLNKLPGTEIPAEAGGGKVGEVQGVIHSGDLIDSGDKADAAHVAMQKTEWAAWAADWGLNGGDGKLRYPVREVWGNHDGPQGKGVVIDQLKKRNTKRKDVNVSANGMHFSWDWNGIHFVNLGLVVGTVKDVDRPRRYAALESLDFLQSDLAERVGNSGRPVVITHHVDVARYCAPLDPVLVSKNEWDYADVAAYHAVLTKYRIAAVLYGHTHVRKIFPWDGTTPKARKETDPKPDLGKGIAVFNTDNSGHFKSEEQALMYFQVTEKEVIAREFATSDSWETAAWTPEFWRYPIA